MTEQHDAVVEWLTELEADPKYQLEEAAADLAIEVSEILVHAFRARADIGQKELAELLGVSEGRVSQVLHGDGNVHMATMAKYLRALGYVLDIKPKSVDGNAPALIRNSRRKLVAHLYKTTFADASGVSEVYSSIVSTTSQPKEALGEPRLVTSRALSPTKRAYVDDTVAAPRPPANIEESRQRVRS